MEILFIYLLCIVKTLKKVIRLSVLEGKEQIKNKKSMSSNNLKIEFHSI